VKRPWMPLYIGDFIADTMHLNATETGIYIRLLVHCWKHGSIPRNPRQLALIAHCDTRLWHQYEATVMNFFDVVDASTAHNKRVSSELLRFAEISNKRKDAAKQKHTKSSANGMQKHTHLHSHSEREQERKEEVAADAASSSANGSPRFAFENGVIRLTAANLEQWRKAFPNLSLESELTGLAFWAQEQKSWFMAVQGALAKRQRQIKLEIDKAKQDGAKPDQPHGSLI
jgi:uncharacterized protein YdaU (DUF1376 family)